MQKETDKAFEVADKAREQSKDPEKKVDIPVATNLPEKASSLVIAAQFEELEGQGVAERIKKLEDEYGKNDERVAFEIASEIAQREFYEFEDLERACDAGIRVGVSYMTGGITTAPLEGIGDIKIRENNDGTEYIAIYYSGPIRSAGGTASAMSVLLADYVRKNVGLDEFKPSETVVKRYAAEVDDYYNRVTAKQYEPEREETEFIAENVPVEVTGSPTERLEVSNYKDLERVDTNQIRGGMCLVYLDGLPLKAPKIKKRIEKWGKDFGLEHWSWVKDYLELQKELHSSGEDDSEDGEESKYTPSDKYLGSLTAGRPVFGHPGREGGFRLRYGHSRTNGLAAVSFHPATMEISERFIAIGTQLKCEYPGKATVGTPCDSIHPPVVRMKDGSVKTIHTREEARKIEDDIDEILFLGDVLVPYGEFVENGKKLLPSPYVEEWWEKELKKTLEEKEMKLGRDFSERAPNPEEAFKISNATGVPLHPKWTHHWRETSPERFNALRNSLKEGNIEKNSKAKKCLEDILATHKVEEGEVKIAKKELETLRKLLRPEKDVNYALSGSEQIPEVIQQISDVEVRNQAPHYIGSRMGRPEKAERRTIKGKPQLLFPCGKKEGGRMRNLSASYDQKMHSEQGIVKQSIIHSRCPECGDYSFFSYCRSCEVSTEKVWFCQDCGKEHDEKVQSCESCGGEWFERYKDTDISVKELMDDAMENLDIQEKPELLKSVRGMSAKHKHVEPIEKGLLRQKYDLYVNKDGTVRYDASDLPMTHFKPKEISVPVERLRKLGYEKDVDGKPLENDEQVVELKPQDIIIPDGENTLAASDYFVRVANFIDDLLERFYGLDSYYDVEEKEDLVGTKVIGLAPHTSGGTVGRIIGFTDAKGIYAHPYWHAAKRRNCLPGDTEVKLSDGTSKSLEQIYQESSVEEEIDATGTREKKIDLDVISVEDESKIKTSKASRVIKTPAQDHKIVIESSSGRKLEVFPDHKVKTKEGVKRARALEGDEKLLVPAKMDANIEDKEKLNLLNYVSEEVVIRGERNTTEELISELGGLKQASEKLSMSKKTLSNYKYRDSVPLDLLDQMSRLADNDYELNDCKIAAKRDNVELNKNIKINSDFMKLLGYYLAEGYSRKSEEDGEEFYQVCFAFGEDPLKENMKELVKNVFGIKPSEGDHILTVSSRLVYDFFESIEIGSGAHDKRIPDFVKRLPKEKAADLLSAYFAGDGSVERGRLHLQATSVSRGLLQDIDTLLKRFGIYARYGQSEREAGGILLEKYGEEKYENRTFTSNKLHIRSSYAQKFGKEIGFDLQRKQKALENDYEKCRKPRVQREGGVILDQIKSISTVKADERFMYDLEVDETHNFLTEDNLITNNCDGDEDAILLLMDGLLNFSRQFLPDMTGARSVTKDTRIFTKINGEFRVKTAEELVDNVLDKEGYEVREDGFEVNREFEENIEAVSFDENGNVELSEVSALIRHENDKQVFKLKTSRGQVSVTEDHSVFVTEGKEVEAKPVRDIEEGDCIIVPSNFELDYETLPDKIDLFELLPDEECYVEVSEDELEQLKPSIEENIGSNLREKYGKHNIYRYKTGRRTANLAFYKDVGVVPSCKVSLKSNADPISRFIEKDVSLFRLIGYLMAEGEIKSGRIYNNDMSIIEDIQKCIEDITGVKKDFNTDSREDRDDNHWVRIPATLRKVLTEIGVEDRKAGNKIIPTFVLGSEKKYREEFLKAYRAGDGSIYEEKGFSKLYTKSGEMASQLTYLVRSLGFKSSTRQAGDTWEVLYSDWTEKDPYWPLWNIKDSVRQSLKEQGLDYEEIKNWMANYRANSRMKTAGKNKIENLYQKGVEELKPVSEGSISVERVVEKNKVDYGDDYVYDLEVPEDQNFLCGPHPVFAHNTMDAPLILSTVLNPDEVDDEAWAIETVEEYPLEFYEETLDYKPPWELETDIEIGEDVVYGDEPFDHGYTHQTTSIDNGPNQSEYVTLDDMAEKTEAQLTLGRKIKAVDENATAELLLKKHFIPDIKGNLRSFSSQKMRCVDCNEKFRRVPMRSQTIAPTGKTTAECPECEGKVLLTISEGTIKKYLLPSEEIIDEYEVSPYVRQQIFILKETLQSLFGKENRQSGLKQFI